MQEYIKSLWALPILLLPHHVRKERGDSLAVAVEGILVMSVSPGRELPGYQIQDLL